MTDDTCQPSYCCDADGCGSYAPPQLNPGGQRHRCALELHHEGFHRSGVGDVWDDRGRVLPARGPALLDEPTDSVLHYWACEGNCGGTCSPELRARLREWIEDVHECGWGETMTDEALTDSLILFVQQEIARVQRLRDEQSRAAR